jgi:hypothetical protein
MKKIYSLFVALALGATVQAQSPCDSVNIVSITYDAMHKDSIELVINNQSSAFFNYPNFILLNAADDTIAYETVNFFGLGNYDQGHILKIEPPFSSNTITGGKLLLKTGFGDSLECIFTSDFELCSEACSELIVSLQSTGPIDSTETINVSVTDSLSNVVYFESFVLDSLVFFKYDSLCLPPGDYTIEFDQLDSNSTTLFFGLNTFFLSTGINGNSNADNTTQHFSIWERCFHPEIISPPNAVDELNAFAASISARVANQTLLMSSSQNELLEHIALYDLSGRLVLDKAPNTSAATINVSHLQHGIYIAKARVNGVWITQQIWL